MMNDPGLSKCNLIGYYCYHCLNDCTQKFHAERAADRGNFGKAEDTGKEKRRAGAESRKKLGKNRGTRQPRIKNGGTE